MNNGFFGVSYLLKFLGLIQPTLTLTVDTERPVIQLTREFSTILIGGTARISTAGTGGATMYVQFNDDAVANHYQSLATVLYPPNTLFTAEDLTSGFGVVGGACVDGDQTYCASAFIMLIMGCRNRKLYKSYVSACFLPTTGAANSTRVFFCGGTWLSLNPINKITFSRGAGIVYRADSTFTALGI